MSKRLIDANALGIGRCNPDAFPLQNRAYCAGWNGVVNIIEQAPTVDAVEVTRCKDCGNAKKYCGGLYCKFYEQTMDEDDFCSKGKKENEK